VSRKPTLSPSKITTYLACPVKFRWTYVDARGKWYLRSKSYYSFGSTLHRVLERFHDAGDLGVTTTEEVKTAYEESWIDAGFTSAEEMAEAYNEGLEILERHVEEAEVRASKGKTLFVERQFELDMGEFRLIGRIDRVDEHPDGTIEIVDYKSGRGTVTTEDVATDVAMSCYQLLLKRKYPDRRVIATIFALRSGAEASAELSETELDELERDLYRLGQEVLSEEYHELTPHYKRICPTCDFLPLCRKHPDFADEEEEKVLEG
jgi:putative RecB family exonuclease